MKTNYCVQMLKKISLSDTLNTQVHESTKQMPYELVFGQPPRSIVEPDGKLRGRCCEEDIIAEDHISPSNYFNILKINVFHQFKFVYIILQIVWFPASVSML